MSLPIPPIPDPAPQIHPEQEEEFRHKGRLQQFVQRSGMGLPVYSVVNEGLSHAPKFRATVVVDGMSFTGNATFHQKKAAEQEVARVALESLLWKVRNEAPPIDPVAAFCKQILYEYAIKLNLEKPTYTTSEHLGRLRSFISYSVFDGQTYPAKNARNKKEAENMAARVVIESILASSSNTGIMSEIIRSKEKLYCATNQDSTLGVMNAGNVLLSSANQNNSNNYIVNGTEAQTANTFHDNQVNIGTQLIGPSICPGNTLGMVLGIRRKSRFKKKKGNKFKKVLRNERLLQSVTENNLEISQPQSQSQSQSLSGNPAESSKLQPPSANPLESSLQVA